MIIVFLVLSIILAIVFLVNAIKAPLDKHGDFSNIKILYTSLCIIFWILGVGLIIYACIFITDIKTIEVIDQKIEMYTDENAKIEDKMDTLVKEYMKHENKTFSDLKTEESAITLVTLYPELKSDALVEQQLNTYLHNNDLIKELKEEKIEIKKKKFILYFG